MGMRPTRALLSCAERRPVKGRRSKRGKRKRRLNHSGSDGVDAPRRHRVPKWRC